MLTIHGDCNRVQLRPVRAKLLARTLIPRIGVSASGMVRHPLGTIARTTISRLVQALYSQSLPQFRSCGTRVDFVSATGTGHTRPISPYQGTRSTVMKLCPNCRRAYDDTLTFCSVDGNPLRPLQSARVTAPVVAARMTARSAMLAQASISSARPSRVMSRITAILVIVCVVFLGGAVMGAYSESTPPPPVTEPVPAPVELPAVTSNSTAIEQEMSVVRTSEEPQPVATPARLTHARRTCSGKR